MGWGSKVSFLCSSGSFSLFGSFFCSVASSASEKAPNQPSRRVVSTTRQPYPYVLLLKQATNTRARLSPPKMHRLHKTPPQCSIQLPSISAYPAPLTMLNVTWPSELLFLVSAPTRHVYRYASCRSQQSRAGLQGCHRRIAFPVSPNGCSKSTRPATALFTCMKTRDYIHAARAVLVGRSECTLGESVWMCVSELMHMVYTDTR
jgi:hypothetical protein